MAREDMRASDGDRSQIAERLKAALDEGRLDLNEYDERLQKTYQAKTYGELEGLLSDLPGPRPAASSQVQPVPPGPVAPGAAGKAGENDGAPWLGGYAGVVAVCVIIWAITSVSSGHLLYFWPVWTMIPLILGFIQRRRGR